MPASLTAGASPFLVGASMTGGYGGADLLNGCSIAVEKGRTSAETRRSTAMWEERIKSGRTAMLRMPGVTPIQGGLPIVIDGECIGAVGVSGVQSHEDEQIAKAGIAVLTS